MFNRILVAIPAGDSLARPLAEVAKSMADIHGAELRFITIAQPMRSSGGTTMGMAGGDSVVALRTKDAVYQAALDDYEDFLVDLRALTDGEPTPTTEFREGLTDAEIVNAAQEWAADLIMIGAHQRNFFERVLKGAPSEAVVRAAPCAVIAIPEDVLLAGTAEQSANGSQQRKLAIA